MMEYNPEKNKELSTIETNSGDIYHIKGAYSIEGDDKSKVLPVNRSYSISGSGDRIHKETNERYEKNKLIHEEIKGGEIFKDSELLVSVYGKELLFLDSKNIKKIISPDPAENILISDSSREIIGILSEDLDKRKLKDTTLVGVFGSHQVGLQHLQSDIDLIIWTDWNLVDDVRAVVADNFKENGYISVNDNSKLEEYAKRYSEKFHIPYSAGLYLAKKRNRWIDKNGTPVSLQILNNDYDHLSAKFFLEGVGEEYSLEKVRLECKVISVNQSYNFPRLWELEYSGKIVTAVSFSWSHQGMGDDGGLLGDKYVFDGYMVKNEKGEFLYLRDDNNYILPKKLL